jgi:hypothetical protein
MSQFQSDQQNTADLSFEDEEVFIESSGTAEVSKNFPPQLSFLYCAAFYRGDARHYRKLSLT